jgi:hypothetical protein
MTTNKKTAAGSMPGGFKYKEIIVKTADALRGDPKFP